MDDKCILFIEFGITNKGVCQGLSVKCEGHREGCSFYKSRKEYTRDLNGFIVKRKEGSL